MSKNNCAADPQFEALLDYLKRSRGFDFTGYKRSSLMRRVEKRMQVLSIDDFSDYIDLLQAHPDEFVQLFNTILINVTSFFRDPEAWEYVKDTIIPRILEAKPHNEQVRVWTAGCASGQETYTISMLLCEVMGLQDFHNRVKIYATDVDEEALTQARQAVYSAKDLESVPQELRTRYFIRNGTQYVCRQDLRRSVIFGRHDLIQDAPISHLDLLICRNTLMYFNAPTQKRIIARFDFALENHGYLFLGKAELLLSHTNLFSQVDLHHRVFSKAVRATRDRNQLAARAAQADTPAQIDNQVRLKELANEISIAPQIAVASTGQLVVANRQARLMFNLKHDAIGRLLQDLELSYRPLDLRSLIDQAYQEGQSISLGKIVKQHLRSGELQYLEVEVVPLYENGGSPLGVNISYRDRTDVHRLKEHMQLTFDELERANEELQSTNEELETTNEELQATNEELETTNEELQSANEELETTNEQLQSTNEELQTTNTELNVLSTQVSETNTYLEAILGSVRSGMIVLERDLKVLAWNERSHDLWGLRKDEVVGESLANLDIGLPVDEVVKAIRQFDQSNKPAYTSQMKATNRRGKAISCNIRISALSGSDGKKSGFVVLIDEAV